MERKGSKLNNENEIEKKTNAIQMEEEKQGNGKPNFLLWKSMLVHGQSQKQNKKEKNSGRGMKNMKRKNNNTK